MTTFNRILIPADLTEKNRRAADVALEFARTGADVVILHVIETIEHLPVHEMQPFYDRLNARALEGLEELADSFRRESIGVEVRVIFGHRVDEIIKFAVDGGFDLIVMSSHRVDADRPSAGFATISYKVGILAPCSVLLVK